MKYIPLTSALLALLLMFTVNAYATTADTGPTTGDIPEDIPEWALKPAIEPDEEPTGTDTDTDTDTEQGYTTIYDTDGSILYTDDPTLQGLVKNTPVPHEAETDTGLFLTKPFDEYTVTEGMLLLFLVLGFILVLWRLVKGVF